MVKITATHFIRSTQWDKHCSAEPIVFYGKDHSGNTVTHFVVRNTKWGYYRGAGVMMITRLKL